LKINLSLPTLSGESKETIKRDLVFTKIGDREKPIYQHQKRGFQIQKLAPYFFDLAEEEFSCIA